MKSGFTLIEVIIVVSITLIIAATVIPLGTGFLYQNQLNTVSADLASNLRLAQISALASKDDSNWGVNVDPNTITMFKGDSYALRDQAFDLHVTIPGGVDITESEVVFQKYSGLPNSQLSFTLIDRSGGQKVMNINQFGIININ